MTEEEIDFHDDVVALADQFAKKLCNAEQVLKGVKDAYDLFVVATKQNRHILINSKSPYRTACLRTIYARPDGATVDDGGTCRLLYAYSHFADTKNIATIEWATCKACLTLADEAPDTITG